MNSKWKRPDNIDLVYGRISFPSWVLEERDCWTPPAKLGEPKAFNLITDPKEEYPATALRNSWNAEPAMKIVAEFEKSLKKYPPIAPGTPDPYLPPKPGP